jgi:hypothetical protein
MQDPDSKVPEFTVHGSELPGHEDMIALHVSIPPPSARPNETERAPAADLQAKRGRVY